LLQERPELISRPLDDRPQQIQDALADWLINRGVTEYNLFWALSASELAGVARKRRGQTRSNARVVHQGGAESPGHPGLRAARSPGAAYKAPALSNLNQYCFGSEYPCISLDVDDPLWAAQAISAGKSRQGATSGVELLSPHIAIRYPTKMNAPSVVLLEFLVPEVFDDKLHIGLNIGSQSHKIRSNSESNRHVVKLISEPSFPPAPLEIEFVSDFAKGRTKSYIGIAFGLIKSLRVWQIERSV
jgi:hypothetical protein